MKFRKIILLFIALQFIYSVSNAQIKLLGHITTNGTASYPTHIDILGMGGYMSMPTIADRDAIPTLRRKHGMLVFVQADGVIYKLNTATIASNNDWVAVATGDMVLASVQTVTGAKTFGAAGAVGKLIIAGTTSGTTILDATAAAGSGTVTLPTTGTLATLAGTETLTNKTLTSPTFTGPILGTPASGEATNLTGTAASLTAGLATSLAGGGGGQLPYQSAAGTTAMLVNGSAGQVLQSNGTTLAPTWVTWVSGLLSKVEGTNFTGSLLVGHATTGTLNAAEYNTGVGLGALEKVTTGDNNTASGYRALYSNTTGIHNTASGYEALYSNTGGDNTGGYIPGSYNTASGYRALYSNTTAMFNTAFGYEALYSNTNSQNTAIGHQALKANTTGTGNTASGWGALRFNQSGSYNTASGNAALYYNTTGIENTAFGLKALYENAQGSYNTAIGMYALHLNKAGSKATAIGNSAMYYANNTTTSFTNTNVAVGFEALRGGFNTPEANTGNGNTALGYQALLANTTGNYNTASGNQALFANTSGTHNTASGREALLANTTGSYNTASGESAGDNITTGSNNTAIGYNAQVPTATASNQVRIGDILVTYAGVNVAWTTTSDKRWKSDIKQSALGLDFIKSLNPVSYVRNNDEKKKTEYGFIAQELEIALNKASAANNGIISKDDAGMYSVRYNDLLSPMVKAIQEQQAQIDEQKKQIEELKLLILSMKK
jgi:hypothetical protein